jgi:hypothetical protein
MAVGQCKRMVEQNALGTGDALLDQFQVRIKVLSSLKLAAKQMKSSS